MLSSATQISVTYFHFPTVPEHDLVKYLGKVLVLVTF